MSAKPRRITPKPSTEEPPKETVAPTLETKPAEITPTIPEKKKEEGHGPLGEPVSKNSVYV